MSSRRATRVAIVAGIMLTVLSVGAAQAASHHFKRPNGHERSAPRQDQSTYINKDGLVCRDLGGVGVCFPPNGTTKYINDEGLNCTRTGIASFCSNL